MAKPMIEQLTPEQEARCPEFVDKWVKIGLSTEPADRPKAEEALKKCYTLAELELPEEIVWFDSPLAMVRQVAEDVLCQEIAEKVKPDFRKKIKKAALEVLRDHPDFEIDQEALLKLLEEEIVESAARKV